LKLYLLGKGLIERFCNPPTAGLAQIPGYL
jgi:hypothetical protein